jgi:hypothetical protein
MLSATHDLIVQLQASDPLWVLAITGGGTSAAADLLSVPGASRTILEVVVPYHSQALADFLAFRPDNSCSLATSQAMARQALQRAGWLAPGRPIIGLGCTASLVSDRPKRGPHRVYVSTARSTWLKTWSLILLKDARDRAGEESVAAALIFHAMAQTLDLSALVPLLPGEAIETTMETHGPLSVRMAGEKAIRVEADGLFSPKTTWSATRPEVLLPGAFNPLHGGHLALLDLAAHLEGKPAAFELSTVNVDKPELTDEEVHGRLGQFIGQAPIWLTRAPRFVDKAALFPGATFVVGADTALRLVAPCYYEDDEQKLRQALDLFRQQDCRFLVASRVDAAGRCLGLDDCTIPATFRDLFRAIPSDVFRMDISSTWVRERHS